MQLFKDPERKDEGSDILMDIAAESFFARAEKEDPGIDPAFSRAVITLTGEGITTPEIPPAELCFAALDSLPMKERAIESRYFASYLYGLGDVDNALICLDRGLKAAAIPFYHSLIWTDKAQFQRRQGRWGAGLDSLSKAIALAKAVEGPNSAMLRAYALGERAQNLMGQGAYGPALKALEAEQSYANMSGDFQFEITSYRHRTDYRLATSDLNGAFDMVTDLVESDDFDALLPAIQAMFHAMAGAALGETARRAGNLKLTLQQADERFAMAQELQGLGALEMMRFDLFRADYAWLGEDRKAARKHLARARERGTAVRTNTSLLELDAYRLALEVKFSEGSTKKINKQLDTAFRSAFDNFLDSWNEIRRDGEAAYLRSGVRREILGQRINLSVASGGKRGVERGFNDLAQSQSRGSLAREGAFAVPTVEAIRENLLVDGHGLLVYVSAPSGGHVFALDDELTHANLAPEPEVWKTCRELRKVIDLTLKAVEPDSERAEKLNSLATETSHLLLPPNIAERVNSWSRVSVVGMEFFFEIPFEILRDAQGKRMGETRAVDRLPSIPVGMSLSQRATSKGPRDLQLLLALEPSSTQFPEIPATEEDLIQLTEPFEDRVTTVRKVTPSRIRETPLNKAAIQLILSHGVYESTAEHAGAALVLEADEGGIGMMRRDDVVDLEVAGVVLLAACEAGRGLTAWGNDRLANLGGAFLEAGASCVIQTSVSIPYRSMLAFMQIVIRELADGASPAEAAQRARMELADSEASELDRLRWAQISVLGLGQR